MLHRCPLTRSNIRNYSKYLDKDKSGKAIRQKFLDYFINKNNHDFVKSSPVVPFCDPTVAFVNAGMNQFKGFFLGNQTPPFKKVANSQKCVRVGGKHNDLNVVGTDGYHHTFFEMLGNWSFGDYFKQEACVLAWKLLTEEYKIHPSRLYVTYFKGDTDLGIEEDVETKEIWKAIGVPEDRILPFTSKDNFWEMGPTGPCGPCTEIHIDHMTSKNRACFVNKGLHDLTELWNIVFIQYNRKNSRSIDLLPEKHVDTGMGFERLTAVLQGKISNYDTDNFAYLLKAIHKNCSKIPEYSGKFGENDWNRLDSAYRILADHVRMITVCLSDSMIPEQNQKLRRIMRRAFLISETVFKKEKELLKELSNYVIDHLGSVYPELEKNARQIHQIIDYEEEVYKSVRKNALDEWETITKDNPELLKLDVNDSPNLVAGFKEIKSTNPKKIDAQLAFKLYDSLGLDEENISSLANALNLPFDDQGLREQLELAKNRSKEQITTLTSLFDQLKRKKVPKTDRRGLYSYKKHENKYVFEDVNIKILKIVRDSELVPEIQPEVFCSLVLDKSNLYTEAGGQVGDRGKIIFANGTFEISEGQNYHGYILHKGFLKASSGNTLKVNQEGSLRIDSEFRLKNMRNHTAVHLLNAALKNLKGATCQKSSKVTQKYLNLDVGIFGDKISLDEVGSIENEVRELITDCVAVNVREIGSAELLKLNDVTLIPGEVYPECGIRLVEVMGEGFLSREPCCGTHVLNTGDLGDFSVISVKSMGRSTTSIHGVTGDRANLAKANGIKLMGEIQNLEKIVQKGVEQLETCNRRVGELKNLLVYDVGESKILPVSVKQQCCDLLQKISKQIKEVERKRQRDEVEADMGKALRTKISKTKKNEKYMVHCVKSSLALDKVTRLCPEMPVLIISYCDNMVKARCCVPEKLRNGSFNAENWLKLTVGNVLQSDLVHPKGYDPSLIANMKSKKIKSEDLDVLLKKSMEAAKQFIDEHL